MWTWLSKLILNSQLLADLKDISPVPEKPSPVRPCFKDFSDGKLHTNSGGQAGRRRDHGRVGSLPSASRPTFPSANESCPLAARAGCWVAKTTKTLQSNLSWRLFGFVQVWYLLSVGWNLSQKLFPSSSRGLVGTTELYLLEFLGGHSNVTTC